MKAIVGIDAGGAYGPAIQLLARFRFEKPDTTLVHFVSPIPTYYPIEAANLGEFQSGYSEAMNNVGRDVLDKAKGRLVCTTFILRPNFGSGILPKVWPI